MILILSHSTQDYPTEYVYDWLTSLGASCKRVNGADLLSYLDFGISIDGTAAGYKWSSPHVDIAEVSAIWVRRWMDFGYFKKCRFEALHGAVERLQNELNAHLESEFRALSHYFFSILKDKPTLGSWFYSGKDPSKAKQLLMAKESGLRIPDTIITDSRSVLEAFFAKYERIICKNISEIGMFHMEGRSGATYTALISQDDLDDTPSKFYPSLFQEAIDKEFELRVFFLGGEIYSMAIFSSNDVQTEIDFRKYNYERPNRTVPVRLPPDVEDRIRLFMRKVELETGSIDLIYSKTGEYYFLEVNPGGQFSMVSIPCNYNLEKKMAEYMINLSNNGKNSVGHS